VDVDVVVEQVEEPDMVGEQVGVEVVEEQFAVEVVVVESSLVVALVEVFNSYPNSQWKVNNK
jgi:hypothetical protein